MAARLTLALIAVAIGSLVVDSHGKMLAERDGELQRRELVKRDDDCFYMWTLMNNFDGDNNNMWLIMQVVNGDIDFEDYLMMTQANGGEDNWLVWLAANGDIDSDYLFYLMSNAGMREGIGAGVMAFMSIVSAAFILFLSNNGIFQ